MNTNTDTGASLRLEISIEPFNPDLYRQAISEGRQILADSGSKASAARHIYGLLQSESRDVVLRAFIEGADVTPKGSPTYFYNISRKFKRMKASTADSTVV